MNPISAKGLRVVMIAPTPFFSDRGCHVRILEEARALIRAGAAVTLCTYSLGKTPPGIDVRRAVRLPGYSKVSAGPSWGKPILDGLLLGLSGKVVREIKPHVIHAHLHEGIAIASKIRSRGAVRVLDVQGGLTEETMDHRFLPDRPLVRRALEGIERRLLHAADFTVTSHQAAAKTLVSRFGVSSSKVRVVGDAGGLPRRDLARVEALRKLCGVGESEPLFLYAGLLGEHQGTQTLLSLAQRLDRSNIEGRILVLGYPEADWVRRAKERGVHERLIFFGRFAYEDLASFLSLGTVALSTKISVTEGNQKLYTYLEAGLPIVAYDTPASRDILGGGQELVPLGDDRAFCEAAISLLTDERRRNQMKQVSSEREKVHGDWDAVAGKILEAYREAGARWAE